LTYASEHVPHTRRSKDAAYLIGVLSSWWGHRRLSEVTAKSCRAYAASRTQSSARRSLEILRAAIGYWHREHGPLPSVPAVVLPPKSEPREKWLTRAEAARLLWAARHIEHVKRFILLGLRTGSRSGAIFSLSWDRIDFAAGVMRRRGYGETESRTKRAPPVRLGKRILQFLRRWRRMDGDRGKYVVHWGGKKINKGFGGVWDRTCKEAGVEATPHTLRHTRATWLMQRGISPWEAAGHLGMSVEILQKVYAKHSPDFQKLAAEV
jgi:integrase